MGKSPFINTANSLFIEYHIFTIYREEISPRGDSFPPLRNSLPPLGDWFPPLKESFPPLGKLFPPWGDSFPPLRDSFPPLRESFPPLEESFLLKRKEWLMHRKIFLITNNRTLLRDKAFVSGYKYWLSYAPCSWKGTGFSRSATNCSGKEVKLRLSGKTRWF